MSCRLGLGVWRACLLAAESRFPFCVARARACVLRPRGSVRHSPGRLGAPAFPRNTRTRCGRGADGSRGLRLRSCVLLPVSGVQAGAAAHGKAAQVARARDEVGDENENSAPIAAVGPMRADVQGAQGILLLARMAGMMEERQEGRPHKQRKLPLPAGTGSAPRGAGVGEGDEDEGSGRGCDDKYLFKYLTHSDLRLTPEALVSTKKSHFRCNVNGCPRSVPIDCPQSLHAAACARYARARRLV